LDGKFKEVNVLVWGGNRRKLVVLMVLWAVESYLTYNETYSLVDADAG
jgi:hypothetical protein